MNATEWKPEALAELSATGWAKIAAEGYEDDLWAALIALGDQLGERIAGRAGTDEEVVTPLLPSQAHVRSLNAVHGLGALPLHVELSHRPKPCRYVLLCCLDAGDPPVGTILLHRSGLGLNADDASLLRNAPVFVRSGRRSFYSTIMPSDGCYLRYDAGCMEAVDGRGAAAMSLMDRHIAASVVHTHRWSRGEILVIDNWNVLHGREAAVRGSGRRLARILVDG